MKIATCENKKVMCEGVEIKDTKILCEGIESSTGVLLFDEDMSPVFVPNAQPDLKDILDLMKQITTACSSITTTINGVPTPIDNASAFATIQTQIETKKTKLI